MWSEAAKAEHPERWNGRATRDWSLPDTVYLNPDKVHEQSEEAKFPTLGSDPNILTNNPKKLMSRWLFHKIYSFKMMVIRQDSVPDVIANKCG